MFLRAARSCFSDDIEQPPRSPAGYECFLAVVFPPLRPAAFFCAVVPPCEASPPEPERSPPCLEASGELAIFAARCLDMPLSFSASYCFSFLTAMILLLVVTTRDLPRSERRKQPRLWMAQPRFKTPRLRVSTGRRRRDHAAHAPENARRAEMGVAEVAGLVVRPAVTGTMRARKTKSRQHSVAKKQWVAYIGVAILSTLLTKLLDDFIERRFAADDADVA